MDDDDVENVSLRMSFRKDIRCTIQKNESNRLKNLRKVRNDLKICMYSETAQRPEKIRMTLGLGIKKVFLSLRN